LTRGGERGESGKGGNRDVNGVGIDRFRWDQSRRKEVGIDTDEKIKKKRGWKKKKVGGEPKTSDLRLIYSSTANAVHSRFLAEIHHLLS